MKTMKTINSILFALVSVIFMTACSSNDEAGKPTELGKDEVLVSFNMDASDITMGANQTRTFGPTYDKSGFSVKAFRKDVVSGKYLFFKELNLANFTFSANKLTGTQILTVGSYKFLVTYGAASTQLTVPSFTPGTTELNEAAAITCAYSNAGLANELFLQTRHQTAQGSTAAGKLKEYNFKVGGETVNDPVKEKLQRAVSRVDVLFISATKAGAVYTERKFVDPTSATKDILDNRAIKLTFDIDEMSNSMSMVGAPSSTSFSTTHPNIVLNYATGTYTNNNKVTVGSGNSTKVGGSTYLTYDNVLAADIIDKSAHVFGTYLFPFASTAKKTNLSLVIEGSKSATDVVTRTIDVTNVPFEQNKVTLIRVYVLGDPGTSVFDTNVTFEVELDTAWLPSNTVNVEVD